MLLARRLVNYSRSTAIDPFSPKAAEQLSRDAAAQSLLLDVGARFPDSNGAQILALLLQTLAIEGTEPRNIESRTECVATLPQAYNLPTRPTRIVIREMMAAARRSVLAAGYAITDGSELLPLCHNAAARNLSITIVCDQTRRDAHNIVEHWPARIPLPKLLINTLPDDANGKMHAKVLIVDDQDLLVTSANFTWHGQEVNIEYGLRLSGEPARQSVLFFRALEQLGVLIPARYDE